MILKPIRFLKPYRFNTTMQTPKSNSNKVLTLHPQGKSGRNIDAGKYDLLKEAILSTLKGKELTHNELFTSLRAKLKAGFVGNLDWYAETLKLDLEARNLIERTDSKPQRYKLKGEFT